MAKRGKGSGSGGGKVKSAGSTDVVVLSDGKGSRSKIRGRGEAPEAQHEPAVANAPRKLTRSKRSRGLTSVKQLKKQRTSKLPGNDVSVSLHSSDDGCSESRSCDGGEKPVRNAKGQRCLTDPSRYFTVVEQNEGERGLVLE